MRKEPAQTETVVDLQFINFIGIYVYDVLVCVCVFYSCQSKTFFILYLWFV